MLVANYPTADSEVNGGDETTTETVTTITEE